MLYVNYVLIKQEEIKIERWRKFNCQQNNSTKNNKCKGSGADETRIDLGTDR